jgi:cell division protein ZapE
VPKSLVDVQPAVTNAQLVAALVPPPRFSGVRFDTYLPDPAEPTQAAAVSALEVFSGRPRTSPTARRRWARRAPQPPEARPGVYLDGGFGVGKTHLLAALWHAGAGPKAFSTFVELTHLVGALGFRPAVEELGRLTLLCIDEFELDDPGDTVLMSTLLGQLAGSGVRLAATSNTLPDRLGEQRFAADDFLREIQGLAAQFDVLRIEGDDYRHRGAVRVPAPRSDGEVVRVADEAPGATLDDFGALLQHLSTLHPSRYGALLDGVSTACWTSVTPVSDQAVALRLVVLADRLYDRDVGLVTSGVPLDQVFSEDMLRGGYRKKYFRALSRLVALARQGG